MKCPHQIHIDHELNLLQFLFLQFPRHKHSLIADQHIDRASLFDGSEDGVLVPDIGGENGDIIAGAKADGISSLLELIHVASKDGDPSALRSGLVGEGEADAAGSAGDEHMAVPDWDLDWLGVEDQDQQQEDKDRGDDEEDQSQAEVRHLSCSST